MGAHNQQSMILPMERGGVRSSRITALELEYNLRGPPWSAAPQLKRGLGSPPQVAYMTALGGAASGSYRLTGTWRATPSRSAARVPAACS